MKSALHILLLVGAAAILRAEEAAPFQEYHQVIQQSLDALLERSAEPPRPETPAPVPEVAAAPSLLVPPATGAMARVARLRPVIDPILRSEGLPAELAAVVLVESGGRPDALSPKSARGLWQLMPDTARLYGLDVSDSRDERVHIEKSTRAAARFLRDLYNRFGNWPLALAAYNAGMGAVENALARAGTADFATLSRRLPEETRRYVPAVLAAMRWFGGGAVQPASFPAGVAE